jgi:hypothetical protein
MILFIYLFFSLCMVRTSRSALYKDLPYETINFALNSLNGKYGSASTARDMFGLAEATEVYHSCFLFKNRCFLLHYLSCIFLTSRGQSLARR